MPALNRVQLIGYLGRDPESKYTPTGKRVTDFPMAVTNRWKDPQGSGETREYTEWVHIEAWGRLAEICHEYLGKGSLVYIEGRLKTEHYEDREGGQRYFTKVVARTVQFLSERQADESFEQQADLTGEEDVPFAEAA
jgi:single-strand DNA-binding protein